MAQSGVKKKKKKKNIGGVCGGCFGYGRFSSEGFLFSGWALYYYTVGSITVVSVLIIGCLESPWGFYPLFHGVFTWRWAFYLSVGVPGDLLWSVSLLWAFSSLPVGVFV
jgi:hypothetical protein